MATWLNAVLSGPCTFTVTRDGVVVTDLATAGASLSTSNGVVTLTTPNAEAHEWNVSVSADFLLSPTTFRMRNFSLTHPNGLLDADAFGSNGQSVALTITQPTAPDPALLPGYNTGASLVVEEDT